MAESYETLRARMSPERRAQNDRETQKLLAELALQDSSQPSDLMQTQVVEAAADSTKQEQEATSEVVA